MIMQIVAGAVIMDVEEYNKRIQEAMRIASEVTASHFEKTKQMRTYLTIKDVAAKMRKSTQTVTKWAKQGHPTHEMKWFFDSSKYLISEYDYLQFINNLKNGNDNN